MIETNCDSAVIKLQYKIMSIYYNHNQNQASSQPSGNRNPNQFSSKQQSIHPLSKDSLNKNKGQGRRSPPGRAQASPVQGEQAEEEWQDIANIHQRHAAASPPKKQSAQGEKKAKRKSPPKEGLKDKLAFIVNYYDEEESVAEITHYQIASDNEDELVHSISTIQSNDRHKYRSLPRKQETQRRNPQASREVGNPHKNRLLKRQGQASDEFALQQKIKQESKPKPKYLFYKTVQEQIEAQGVEKPLNQVKPSQAHSPRRNQALQLINQPDYVYEKGEHPPSEKKKTRLKNKLGFIFDLFHKNEEVASVSYYSESHDSHKESVEIKPKDPLPQQKKVEKQQLADNIFRLNARQEEDEQQPRSNKKGRDPVEQPNTSNQFQSLNFPVSPIQQSQPLPLPIDNKQTTSKQLPNESAFSKIKKSIKINNSLERVELEMVQINRNRSKSKLSATKSVENKPKAQRYETGGDELQNEEGRAKKQSVDLRDLSRHIKKSVNRQSSNSPSSQSPNDPLSKSQNASSKFSMKLVEIQLHKSTEKEDKSFSQRIPSSPKSLSNKNAKEEPFEEETTVKKVFPIARKVSIAKNNSNFSKYMKIDFKEQNDGNENEVPEEISTTFIKKADPIQPSRPYEVNKQAIKLTNANTDEEASKINLKPVNKVDFNLDRTKRFNTELLPRKDDLSDQEKKFLALLRKREDALLRRVKEQVLNNNPSIILRENIEEHSKGNSNETFEKMMSKEESRPGKSPKNYYQAERRDKMSLKSEHPKDPELKSFFPTLNMSPSINRQKFQTFYNNNPLKRTNSKNANYNSGKKKGFSEHISSDSERGKTLDDRFQDLKSFKKEPSKISYYNIKKLHKESSVNEKNLNSKEKYERLKQLLQQI